MPDPASFTDEENWSGGFYELALELGNTNDERLQQALSALWPAANIDGCYGRHDREPDEQDEVALSLSSLTSYGHLRGTVLLPTGPRVVCGCLAHREEAGSDWLEFYLPLGSLARTDRRIGGFPFDSNSGEPSLIWRHPLDDWLAAIAIRVFAQAPFHLGRIRFELDFNRARRELHGAQSDQRWEGRLVPVGTELQFTPANR
jgi:hypothetical protein